MSCIDQGFLDLDGLIQSCEFENKQYVKQIEKENQHIEALVKEIEEKQNECSQDEQVLGQLDEETKRAHRQLTLDRDNLHSLRQTGTLLVEHEIEVENKLQALIAAGEVERLYQEGVITNYEQTYTEYMIKYRSFAYAAELEESHKKINLKEKALLEVNANIRQVQKKINNLQGIAHDRLIKFVVKLSEIKVETNRRLVEKDRLETEIQGIKEQVLEVGIQKMTVDKQTTNVMYMQNCKSQRENVHIRNVGVFQPHERRSRMQEHESVSIGHVWSIRQPPMLAASPAFPSPVLLNMPPIRHLTIGGTNSTDSTHHMSSRLVSLSPRLNPILPAVPVIIQAGAKSVPNSSQQRQPLLLNQTCPPFNDFVAMDTTIPRVTQEGILVSSSDPRDITTQDPILVTTANPKYNSNAATRKITTQDPKLVTIAYPGFNSPSATKEITTQDCQLFPSADHSLNSILASRNIITQAPRLFAISDPRFNSIAATKDSRYNSTEATRYITTQDPKRVTAAEPEYISMPVTRYISTLDSSNITAPDLRFNATSATRDLATQDSQLVKTLDPPRCSATPTSQLSSTPDPSLSTIADLKFTSTMGPTIPVTQDPQVTRITTIPSDTGFADSSIPIIPIQQDPRIPKITATLVNPGIASTMAPIIPFTRNPRFMSSEATSSILAQGPKFVTTVNPRIPSMPASQVAKYCLTLPPTVASIPDAKHATSVLRLNLMPVTRFGTTSNPRLVSKLIPGFSSSLAATALHSVPMSALSSDTRVNSQHGLEAPTLPDPRVNSQHVFESPTVLDPLVNSQHVLEAPTLPDPRVNSPHILEAPTSPDPRVNSRHGHEAPTLTDPRVYSQHILESPTVLDPLVNSQHVLEAPTLPDPRVNSPHILEASTLPDPRVNSQHILEVSTLPDPRVNSQYGLEAPTMSDPTDNSQHVLEAPTLPDPRYLSISSLSIKASTLASTFVSTPDPRCSAAPRLASRRDDILASPPRLASPPILASRQDDILASAPRLALRQDDILASASRLASRQDDDLALAPRLSPRQNNDLSLAPRFASRQDGILDSGHRLASRRDDISASAPRLASRQDDILAAMKNQMVSSQEMLISGCSEVSQENKIIPVPFKHVAIQSGLKSLNQKQSKHPVTDSGDAPYYEYMMVEYTKPLKDDTSFSQSPKTSSSSSDEEDINPFNFDKHMAALKSLSKSPVEPVYYSRPMFQVSQKKMSNSPGPFLQTFSKQSTEIQPSTCTVNLPIDRSPSKSSTKSPVPSSSDESNSPFNFNKPMAALKSLSKSPVEHVYSSRPMFQVSQKESPEVQSPTCTTNIPMDTSAYGSVFQNTPIADKPLVNSFMLDKKKTDDDDQFSFFSMFDKQGGKSPSLLQSNIPFSLNFAEDSPQSKNCLFIDTALPHAKFDLNFMQESQQSQNDDAFHFDFNQNTECSESPAGGFFKMF